MKDLKLFTLLIFYLWLLTIILNISCVIRVDWDKNGKPARVYTYEHPHDGNLTKAEIARNQTPSNGNGMYKIKTDDELKGGPINNCVSKIAKCMGDCNRNYDVFSSYFALKVAVIQAKRATCYDECYNDLSPGCEYPVKRIQY